jgi:hypothetical protein
MSTGDNKRKRSDEDSVTAAPDRIQSHDTTDINQESNIVLPDDGDLPTVVQLADILSFIERPGNTQRSFDDVLKTLGWLVHLFYRTEGDYDQEFVKMKRSFIELGGLLRMVMLIQTHMDKPKAVYAAAYVCASTVFVPSAFRNTEFEEIVKATSKTVINHGGLRMLLLASEELVPSDQETNWLAVKQIWRCLRNILVRAVNDADQEHLILIVEASGQYLVEPSNSFVNQKIRMLYNIAGVLWMILRAHEDAMKPVFREKHQVLHPIHEFCKNHKSDWLENKGAVQQVLKLCAKCVDLGIITKDDLLKWLPLVLDGLSKWFGKKIIERAAYSFIKCILKATNHRELEKTPLPTTLMGIVQSNDADEKLKTKYRKVIADLMTS